MHSMPRIAVLRFELEVMSVDEISDFASSLRAQTSNATMP